MARQRRILSLDEQLEKVISDIETTEKHLQELKESKKDIEEKNQNEKHGRTWCFDYSEWQDLWWD